jgi:hypothetical protein
MRFSTIAALCAAPFALATSLEDGLVMRGAMESSDKNSEKNNNDNNNKGGKDVVVAASETVSITQVIVIWVNLGGTATTQTINTVTETAGAAAVTHTVSFIVCWYELERLIDLGHCWWKCWTCLLAGIDLRSCG